MPPNAPQLQRHLTQTDTIGLCINGVFGAGLFVGLGPLIAGLGAAALPAVLIAGLLALIIAYFYAWLGQRFQETGGLYLYARQSFPHWLSFQLGWTIVAGAILSAAALSHALVDAIAHFLPNLAEPIPRRITAVLVIAGFAWLNLKGVQGAGRVSLGLAITKTLPVLAIILFGITKITPDTLSGWRPDSAQTFASSILLFFYAYVGFEGLATPAGEMKNPRTAVPRAIWMTLVFMTLIYTLITATTLALVTPSEAGSRVLAQAGTVLFGPVGGTILAAGMVLSITGINSAAALANPRRIFAMAEHHDLPAWLRRIDPRSGTPRSAILTYTLITALIAAAGSFKDLASVTVLSRIIQYIAAITLVLSMAQVQGPHRTGKTTKLMALLGLGLCLWLASGASSTHLIVTAIVVGSGFPAYYWFHGRNPKPLST